MKKITLLFLFVGLLTGFSANADRTDLGVYRIKSPVVNSNIQGGVQTTFVLVVANKTTHAFPVTDTMFLFLRVGTMTPQLLTAYKLPNPLNVGDSIDLTLNLTIPSSLLPGGGPIDLGFGMLWKGNPTPGSVTFVFNRYNFVTGLEEYSKPISKAWYSNGSLNVELSPKANCDAQITFTNLNGQMIKSDRIKLTSGNDVSESYDFNNLPAGIYILNIRTPYGTDSRKLLVN